MPCDFFTSYHNLTGVEKAGKKQTFYYDSGVSILEEGIESTYADCFNNLPMDLDGSTAKNIVVKDEQTEEILVYPYYVGDGGITLGVGHQEELFRK